MPISLNSKTFQDEFNSASSQFIASNVSDKNTVTYQISTNSIVDAGLIPSDKIIALNSSSLIGAIAGKQAFELPLGVSQDFINEINNNANTEITVDNFSGAINGTYTVNSIFNGNTIICNEAHAGDKNANNGVIVVSETITDCCFEYVFGDPQAGNSPAFEILGSNQPIVFKTTNSPLDASDTVTVNTIPFQYLSENNIGSFTIRGLGLSDYTAANGTVLSNVIQSFEIIHTLHSTPISINNKGGNPQPENATLPLGDINSGRLFENSTQTEYLLTGSFSTAVNGGTNYLFENLETPDVSVFDLKYNGGNSNYSISNLSIVRTSDSENSGVPIIQEQFTVSFDIENSVDNPFNNSNTKIKVGIENILDDIDNTKNYEDALLYDRAINTLGAGAVNGGAVGDSASITNYTCTFNSISSVSISFEVEFSANAITQINDGQNFFSIFAQTQNHLLDNTNSDRVTLTVYQGIGIQKILANPIEVVSTQFITAPYSQWGNGIDASEIDGFPVQLLCASTRFFANWDNRPNLRIRNVTQSLVLKNSSTLEEITLEDETINVEAFPLVSNQYPLIDYDVNKGYKIPADEVRNRVRMYNDGDAANTHFFEVIFPFFIRWESYTELILDDVPASIIDNTKRFDGRNYFINRIDDLANWSLNYRLNFDCEEDGQTFSQDFDEEITTTGYNEHPEVSSRTLTTYEEDGINVLTADGNSGIDNDGKTLIEVVYDLADAVTDVDDFEVEFFLEGKQNGSPTKIQRISSVNGLLSSSWFTDTGAGDGLIEKSISSGNAVAKALIDNDKLAIYDNYKLYSCLYTPPRPEEFILTESGENITTESGENLLR